METEIATLPLPARGEMLRAMRERDGRYDGVFFTAVRTTGIFCRPSCPARKPHAHNVEFYATAREALYAGYRACKRCRPLEIDAPAPDWVRDLLALVERDPDRRLTEGDLRAMRLDPSRVRRWFQRHHGMTFHAYQRGLRLGRALGAIGSGDPIAGAAYGNGYGSLSGFYDAMRKLTGRSPGAARDATVVRFSRICTPLGTMVAGATDEGLCLLEFVDRRMLETQLRRLTSILDCVIMPGTNEILRRTDAELGEYFAGRRRAFTVPLVMPGTEFQRRVWEILRQIPYGETRSYAEQAARLGRPDAIRAVGRANGDNRIAILVPCHRVVGNDGRLTGYGGGLWRKRRLLALEGVSAAA